VCNRSTVSQKKNLAFSSLLSQQDVDLLLDPVLVVGRVGLRRALEDETAEIGQVIDEVKQLTDVVGDGRAVGVHALQVLLVDLAYPFHAFVY